MLAWRWKIPRARTPWSCWQKTKETRCIDACTNQCSLAPTWSRSSLPGTPFPRVPLLCRLVKVSAWQANPSGYGMKTDCGWALRSSTELEFNTDLAPSPFCQCPLISRWFTFPHILIVIMVVCICFLHCDKILVSEVSVYDYLVPLPIGLRLGGRWWECVSEEHLNSWQLESKESGRIPVFPTRPCPQ